MKAPTRKAATKKAPAKKASTATEDKAAPDVFAEVAKRVEGLTEAAAFSRLDRLIHSQAADAFEMGGILAKIQTEGWFGEHPNFRTLIENEFGMTYRTAMAYLAMYNAIIESGVEYEKVQHLGWTKISILAPILNEENIDKTIAAVADMNTLQVQEFVRDLQKGESTPEQAKKTAEDIKSKTFKLFAPQLETVDMALEKAQTATGSESTGHNLEMICQDFLAGNTGKKKDKKAKDDGEVDNTATLVDRFSAIRAAHDDDLQAGLMEVLNAIDEVWPEANIEVELEEEED